VISLLVKGNREQALSAARSRKIQVRTVLERTSARTETILHCSSLDSPSVIRWYCEDPGDAPFPPGTLMHYSEI